MISRVRDGGCHSGGTKKSGLPGWATYPKAPFQKTDARVRSETFTTTDPMKEPISGIFPETLGGQHPHSQAAWQAKPARATISI